MWIVFALSASLLWGLTYVLNEQVYKKISVLTSLSITSLVMFLATLFLSSSSGFLKKDLIAVSSSKRLLLLIVAETVTLILAELAIGFSITEKNATLAGLIEISYPIFIAIFAYFLLRERVSLTTIMGGILIFFGVFIIYYFNK